jgi:hypothetical protein
MSKVAKISANQQLVIDLAEAMEWNTGNKDHELYQVFKDQCEVLILEDPEQFKGERFRYEKINDFINSQKLKTASVRAKQALAAFKARSEDRG